MRELWHRLGEQWATKRVDFIVWTWMTLGVSAIAILFMFNAAPILFLILVFLALRSWKRRKKFPAFLVGCSAFFFAMILADVYLVTHEDVEVNASGNPSTPKALARFLIDSTRFHSEQLLIVSRLIDQAERTPITSITEETEKEVAPEIARLQSQMKNNPQLQKVLAENELRRTTLQREAEAHEKYAETLRRLDQINREKAEAAEERSKTLARLYAMKQSLSTRLARHK